MDIPLCGLVIPLFEPSSENVKKLTKWLRLPDIILVVIDDGSPRRRAWWSEVELLESGGAYALALPSNSGIAVALNEGVRIAREKGADYILTLDQDSDVDISSVRHAMMHLRDERSKGVSVMAVVPGQIDNHARIASTTHQYTRSRFAVRGRSEPIQSGTIYDAHVFDVVGFFREDFVIDCVDTEHWLRMCTVELQTIVLSGYVLHHELGELTSGRGVAGFFGVRRAFATHSPLRRYYMVRNRLICIRAYGWRYPRWAIDKLLSDSKDICVALVAGPRPGSQLLATTLGLRDGARNRTGTAPDLLTK